MIALVFFAVATAILGWLVIRVLARYGARKIARLRRIDPLNQHWSQP